MTYAKPAAVPARGQHARAHSSAGPAAPTQLVHGEASPAITARVDGPWIAHEPALPYLGLGLPVGQHTGPQTTTQSWTAIPYTRCSQHLRLTFSQVEGTIPEELVGTYFRNGPGMQVRKQHVGPALPQRVQQLSC